MEMTLNVKITGLENLVAVLEKFISTVPQIANDSVPAVTTTEQAMPAIQTQSVPINPVQAPQPAPQAISAVPVSQPVAQPVAAVPVAPTPVVQAPAVPTTVQTYTQEQLALAATALVDTGRLKELQALLATFGIQALTQLPQEQYGNFATQLRALGAKI